MTDNLIIVGDEAWTPEEWEAERRRRSYSPSPKRREWQRNYLRNYQKQPHWRAYKTRWQQIQRAEEKRTSAADTLVRVVGSLHGLGCTGPTKATGCRCSKKLVVTPVELEQ